MRDPAKPIRVMVVEDTAVVRELLVGILGEMPAIEIVGTAADGESAVTMARQLRPDVITMDVNMPGMNGIDATRKIMELSPTRVVVVTGSLSKTAVETSFRALAAGAVAVVRTPPGPGHPEYEALKRELLETIDIMSEVLVVRRWNKRPVQEQRVPVAVRPLAAGTCEIVAIGGSTGGPPVLLKILASLSRPFPVPVVIVQHIAKGFDEGLVDWLGRVSGFPVRLPGHNSRLDAGCAYVVPWGFEATIARDYTIRLKPGDTASSHCPSVTYLFNSVRQTFGARSVGVLLTGMGRDGADELLQLRQAGAATLVQEPETCAVPGMPGEALRLNAATEVHKPDELAAAISRHVHLGHARKAGETP